MAEFSVDHQPQWPSSTPHVCMALMHQKEGGHLQSWQLPQSHARFMPRPCMSFHRTAQRPGYARFLPYGSCHLHGITCMQPLSRYVRPQLPIMRAWTCHFSSAFGYLISHPSACNRGPFENRSLGCQLQNQPTCTHGTPA